MKQIKKLEHWWKKNEYIFLLTPPIFYWIAYQLKQGQNTKLLIFQIIQKQNPMFHNSTTSFGRWFFSAIPRMRWCELSEVNSQWMPRSNWCPHIPRFWYRSGSGACTRCLGAWTDMGSSPGSTLPLAAAPFFFFVFFNHILFSNARTGKWRISVFGSIGPDPRP